MFSEDEMLSQFSIPRFKFGQIDIDIPVLLNGLSEADTVAQPDNVHHSDPDSLADTIIGRTERIVLAKTGTQITARQRQNLFKQTVELTQASFRQSQNMTVNLRNQFSLKTSQMIVETLQNIKKLQAQETDFKSLGKDIDLAMKAIWEAGVKIEKAPSTPMPAAIDVLADYTSLKDHGNDVTVSKVRVTLHEDSVSWKTILDDDGSVRSILTASD